MSSCRLAGGSILWMIVPLADWMSSPTCGVTIAAAVGERRVDDRELQRADLHVALADSDVDVVTDRPVRVVGDPAAAGRARGCLRMRPS